MIRLTKMNDPEQVHICPNCGRLIEENRYVKRPDGSYRCEHCYFKDTYLDGVVHQIDTAYLVTLEALVSAIDAREHEMGAHSLRVTEFALVIADACGVAGRDLVDIYCGALLHDLGKIGVPDTVLLKKGPLTNEEQAIMHQHPETGYRIIHHIGYFAKAAEIIRSHHEHFDGSGYPRKLKGEDIPYGARIFAIADALDALTVQRPYREAISFEDAQEEIQKSAGTIFDPVVARGFSKASSQLNEYIGRIVFDGMNHE